MQAEGRKVEVKQGQCAIGGFQVRYAGATDPGRVRRCNEDGLLLHAPAGIFAVADGLGGLDAGDVASSTALSHLRELASVPPRLSSGSPLAFLAGAGRLRRLETLVAAVNSRTYEHRLALGKNMATTLAVAQLVGDQALLAHVGDSRIYLWRDHDLRRLTSDHSLVNELCQQGALTADQAEHSPQRHVITRAVGAGPSVVAALHKQAMRAGDLLLLCTDGLTSMAADAEIACCLQEADGDLGRSTEQLIVLANEAGGHDNVTVALVAVGAE